MLENYKDVFLDSGDDFEGEFQLQQLNAHPGCSFDATVKVRYKRVKTGRYGSPLDPIDIQFTLTDPTGYTSGLLSGHACKVWIDRYRIKGMHVFFIEIIKLLLISTGSSYF